MNLNQFKTEILPIKDKLFRMAFRVLKDTAAAQDVVQEVFIKLWGKRTELSEFDNLEAFAMKVTKNLAIDKTRSKHQRVQSLAADYDAIESQKNPLDFMMMNDTIKHIKKLMDNLPQKQKLVMHLRDIEGFSYQEITEVMSIPMNQVKVNLFRARQYIKKEIIARGLLV